MHTYSDEYIDCWGEVFVHHDLFARHSVRFETFLQAPDEILIACMQSELDYEPLLPEQKRVQERLDQETEITSINGQPVELHGDHLLQPTHKRSPSKGYKTNTRRAHG